MVKTQPHSEQDSEIGAQSYNRRWLAITLQQSDTHMAPPIYFLTVVCGDLWRLHHDDGYVADGGIAMSAY